MFHFIHDLLVNQGVDAALAGTLEMIIQIILVIILSVIANYVAKRIILKYVTRAITYSETKWDDVLLERGVFNRLSHLAPALVIYYTVPSMLAGYEQLLTLITNAVFVYMIVIGILVFDSVLDAFIEIYRTFEVAKEIPIKGFIQIIKLAVIFIGVIFTLSIVLGKAPFFFLSGLGAMTAVLMLIFKDSILGFVAGIQLISNKMVARGDWIEMPKYDADGDVLDVSLTTVKVSNWDKTVTTIPTYALISESFKNWRGMQESGGRRIKRAVYIDMNSIQFCTEEMLNRFASIRFISDYIEKKRQEISDHNASLSVDDSDLVNGRHLTNIGTFRAYVVAYLHNHPMINRDMTFLVRHLAPEGNGLPIEIYVFCTDKVWANYEAIQADIFDHILAVAPEFDLRVFQHPSGSDFREFAGK